MRRTELYIKLMLFQKPVSGWSAEDVSDWLDHVKMGSLAPKFRAQRVDGPALLSLRLNDLPGLRVPV